MPTVSSPELPSAYYLEVGTETISLYRSDGSRVGVFGSRGAEFEPIRLLAEEDGAGDSVHDAEGASARVVTPIPAPLRVRFLGGFDIFCGDIALAQCHNAKARAILRYLLAHRCQATSRDFLMDWLWPNVTPKKARWSLYSCIHALRRFLADHLRTEHAEKLLLYEKEHYRLCPNLRTESDVEEFDERYACGRRLEVDGSPSEAAREYEAAVELYRGDYLPEDLYEDWTMVERQRLIDHYVYMLNHLAAHYGRTGQCQRGIETCYLLLKKEPCHEESHRRLIGHYTRLGLWEQAFEQYRLCTHALKSRYGGGPSPDTYTAYRNALIHGEIGELAQAH